MRPNPLGIFALYSGYALTGNALPPAQNIKPPASLRPLVPLGNVALGWRAKRLLEEAQMDWQQAQEVALQASDENFLATGDFIEDFVDPDSLGFAPPISTQEVTLPLKTYTGSWPALDLDEVDLELFDL